MFKNKLLINKFLTINLLLKKISLIKIINNNFNSNSNSKLILLKVLIPDIKINNINKKIIKKIKMRTRDLLILIEKYKWLYKIQK
jgi:hypothetical protein